MAGAGALEPQSTAWLRCSDLQKQARKQKCVPFPIRRRTQWHSRVCWQDSRGLYAPALVQLEAEVGLVGGLVRFSRCNLAMYLEARSVQQSVRE